MIIDENTAQLDNHVDTIWSIDHERTTIEFDVKTMLFKTVTARFAGVRGQISLDEKDLPGSRVEATIEATSIATGNSRWDAQLRSATILDTARFPTIRFRSTQVDALGFEHLRVTGDLTVGDVTHPVVLEARIGAQRRDERGKMGAHFMAQTTINRRDFALSSGLPVWVGKTLTIRLAVQAFC